MSNNGLGWAVPSASQHHVSNAPDAAVATAILAFVHTLETSVGSLNSRDRQGGLARYAAAALDAAEGGPAQAALERALEDCGWDGTCFASQPDAFKLGARLKSLLYRGLRQQGEGTYSTVFRGSSLLTGGGVALKYMKLDSRDLRQGFPAFALREISLLRQLSGCPNIVQLQDVLWDRRSLYLVMEQLSCDLKEHLDCDPAARQLPAVKSAMYQALKGVCHAHAHRIIHRDIKPQNLLLDRATGAVKVADFGLARNATPPLRPFTHEVVTLLYRAPEILLGSPTYGSAVDVWALGCVLAELSTGRPLFFGDSEISQLLAIFRVMGTPTEADWPGVSKLPDWSLCFPAWKSKNLAQVVPLLDPTGLDLLRAMLRYDPASRIRCRQALAHPWFDDVRGAEEARGAAVMDAVRRASGERRARMEAAAAAYSHLQEPEGPSTPAEMEAAGAANTGLASGHPDAAHQARVLAFSSP